MYRMCQRHGMLRTNYYKTGCDFCRWISWRRRVRSQRRGCAAGAGLHTSGRYREGTHTGLYETAQYPSVEQPDDGTANGGRRRNLSDGSFVACHGAGNGRQSEKRGKAFRQNLAGSCADLGWSLAACGSRRGERTEQRCFLYCVRERRCRVSAKTIAELLSDCMGEKTSSLELYGSSRVNRLRRFILCRRQTTDAVRHFQNYERRRTGLRRQLCVFAEGYRADRDEPGGWNGIRSRSVAGKVKK